MDETPISAREFGRAVDDMKAQIRDGFLGVHSRLDRVNGRLDKHDVAIGELAPAVSRAEAQIEGIGFEIRDLKEDARQPLPPPMAPPVVALPGPTHEESRRVVSKRDDAITVQVPMNAKTLTVAVTALGMLVAALVKALWGL